MAKEKSKRYPAEVKERAVRLFRESKDEHPSEWAAMRSIAEKIRMQPRVAAFLGAAVRAG